MSNNGQGKRCSVKHYDHKEVDIEELDLKPQEQRDEIYTLLDSIKDADHLTPREKLDLLFDAKDNSECSATELEAVKNELNQYVEDKCLGDVCIEDASQRFFNMLHLEQLSDSDTAEEYNKHRHLDKEKLHKTLKQIHFENEFLYQNARTWQRKFRKKRFLHKKYVRTGGDTGMMQLNASNVFDNNQTSSKITRNNYKLKNTLSAMEKRYKEVITENEGLRHEVAKLRNKLKLSEDPKMIKSNKEIKNIQIKNARLQSWFQQEVLERNRLQEKLIVKAGCVKTLAWSVDKTVNNTFAHYFSLNKIIIPHQTLRKINRAYVTRRPNDDENFAQDEMLTFSKVFRGEDRMTELYKEVKPYVKMFLQGKNSSLIITHAYETNDKRLNEFDISKLTALVLHHLCKRRGQFEYLVSSVDLIEEDAIDVLSRRSNNVSLGEKTQGVILQGLTQHAIPTPRECNQIVSLMSAVRQTGHRFVVIKQACSSENYRTERTFLLGNILGFDDGTSRSNRRSVKHLKNIVNLLTSKPQIDSDVNFAYTPLTLMLKPIFNGYSKLCFLLVASIGSLDNVKRLCKLGAMVSGFADLDFEIEKTDKMMLKITS